MEVVEKGYILVEDGRIIDKGPGAAPSDLNINRINAEGMIVAPSFINMHTHIGDSVAKEAGIGLSVTELVAPPDGLKHRILRSTPDAELMSAMRDTMLDMLSSGTTTFADFRENGLRGVELLLHAARDLPIRPFICGRPDKLPCFTNAEFEANQKQLPKVVAEETENILKIADAISCSIGNDLTDPAMEQMAAISTRLGKMRAIHVAERGTKHPRTGMSDVERVVKYYRPNFVVHMTNASDDDIDTIARNRIPVVCCPRANARLGEGVPPIKKMIESGITLTLGTDNVMLNSPDLFREMEYVSKFMKGLEKDPKFLHPREVLKMVTINAARALALDKDVGSIDKDKLANLVFIDSRDRNLKPVLDPIASIVHRATPENVKAIMVRGKLLRKKERISRELQLASRSSLSMR